MDRRAHWNTVYTTKASTDVSWYQPVPARSLALLQERLVPPARIIDIGGGDSTLVDALLESTMGEVTVLDISGAALERARVRLGERAGTVCWIEGDVTQVDLPATSYDAWHDRAVFHFLTVPDDQARYAALAAHAVAPGGTLMLATFAVDGPARCSGLDVVRYSPETLWRAVGDAFALEDSFVGVHRTPSGAEQRFLYAVFRRV
jgi:SAM-dependent methyltransferase